MNKGCDRAVGDGYWLALASEYKTVVLQVPENAS